MVDAAAAPRIARFVEHLKQVQRAIPPAHSSTTTSNVVACVGLPAPILLAAREAHAVAHVTDPSLNEVAHMLDPTACATAVLADRSELRMTKNSRLSSISLKPKAKWTDAQAA